MYTEYLNKFEDKKVYHIQGSYRQVFHKGPELVRVFDKENNEYKLYEMVNFFYTDPSGFACYVGKNLTKVYDIEYVKPMCGYNDNWLFCLEEEK